VFGKGPVEAGVVVTSTPVPAVRSDENKLLDIVRMRVSDQLGKNAS
jgi:hypothetical protein